MMTAEELDAHTGSIWAYKERLLEIVRWSWTDPAYKHAVKATATDGLQYKLFPDFLFRSKREAVETRRNWLIQQHIQVQEALAACERLLETCRIEEKNDH